MHNSDDTNSVLFFNPDIFFQIMLRTHRLSLFQVIGTSKYVSKLFTNHLWKSILELNYSRLLNLMKSSISSASYYDINRTISIATHRTTYIINSASDKLNHTIVFNNSIIPFLHQKLKDALVKNIKNSDVNIDDIKSSTIFVGVLKRELSIKFTFEVGVFVVSSMNTVTRQQGFNILRDILLLTDPVNIKSGI